jgi:sterol desaturase/sphingolipid hydroxylase (fatty acid hydroxylase superfamily)
VAMLGVLAWWMWLMLSWAFFLLMPWLINHSFARFYPQTRIDPVWRIVVLQEARKGRWKSLIGLHLINSGIIGLCIAAGGWLQAAGIGHLYGGPLGLRGWLLFVPQVLLVLIVFDTQFYWVHRAAHAWPLLYRRLHRDHHVDRFPDIWSAMKQHPLDLFLTTAMPMAWVVLLPIHEAAWLAALLLANYINLAGHSGFEVTRYLPGLVTPNGLALRHDPYRSGIARWVNTVMHHDIHHQLVHSNYSLYFTHWDRWMGSQAMDQSCP